ncbi:MAG: DUF2064 domain-containing protein [Mycobacteriales bacterium]
MSQLPIAGPVPAVALIVVAKAPVAGLAKTRLAPAFGFNGAARLAAAALADTLSAVSATPAARRFLVLEGSLAPPPAGFEILPQRGTGLDERLAAAFTDVHDRTRLPTLLVGMDTPQLTSGLLSAAVTSLLRPGTDAVLGPAADGGWWTLGLRRADPALLLGVPMSTERTGTAQRQRLVGAGLTVADLPVLRDVDTPADAAAVAAMAPASAFAHALERLSLSSGIAVAS